MWQKHPLTCMIFSRSPSALNVTSLYADGYLASIYGDHVSKRRVRDFTHRPPQSKPGRPEFFGHR